MIQSVAGDRWSVECPSLAYHWAFDLCAVEVNRGGGPTAVFASSFFYARELGRRLAGNVVLHFTHEWGMDQTEIRSAMGPEIDWDRVSLESVQDGKGNVPLSTAIWAEPEAQTWKDTLSEIHRLAFPAARLYILGTTGLRRLLPEWRRVTSLPAHEPLSSYKPVVRALGHLGWIIEQMYGFHGPLSLLLGTASRLPAALGREDLVDRCFAALRQTYVVRGWQAKWAPVWVLISENKRSLNNAHLGE